MEVVCTLERQRTDSGARSVGHWHLNSGVMVSCTRSTVRVMGCSWASIDMRGKASTIDLTLPPAAGCRSIAPISDASMSCHQRTNQHHHLSLRHDRHQSSAPDCEHHSASVTTLHYAYL